MWGLAALGADRASRQPATVVTTRVAVERAEPSNKRKTAQSACDQSQEAGRPHAADRCVLESHVRVWIAAETDDLFPRQAATRLCADFNEGSSSAGEVQHPTRSHLYWTIGSSSAFGDAPRNVTEIRFETTLAREPTQVIPKPSADRGLCHFDALKREGSSIPALVRRVDPPEALIRRESVSGTWRGSYARSGMYQVDSCREYQGGDDDRQCERPKPSRAQALPTHDVTISDSARPPRDRGFSVPRAIEHGCPSGPSPPTTLHLPCLSARGRAMHQRAPHFRPRAPAPPPPSPRGSLSQVAAPRYSPCARPRAVLPRGRSTTDRHHLVLSRR